MTDVREAQLRSVLHETKAPGTVVRFLPNNNRAPHEGNPLLSIGATVVSKTWQAYS